MNQIKQYDRRKYRNNLLLLALLINASFLTKGVNAFCNPFILPALKQRKNSPAPSFLQQQRRQAAGHLDRNAVVSKAKNEGASFIPDVMVEEGEEMLGEIYNDAIKATLLWVVGAGVFGAGLWFGVAPTTGEEFFAGYLVEQSLSVDNLFVFLLLFEYFKVPLQYQSRVLNWGIYGAMAMRAVMIALGSVAIQNFHEILLVFAAILLFSSGKILVELFSAEDEKEEDFGQNAIVTFSQNLINASPNFDGDKFFTITDGVKQATPLLLCLFAVELSDVVFAVDSIPAVFGVTQNPLVVFTSNIFAIMGLRSLYTILSKAATDLKYLEPAVAVVLGFIGAKMIAEYFGYLVPTQVALAVVASLLGVGVGASIWERRQEAA